MTDNKCTKFVSYDGKMISIEELKTKIEDIKFDQDFNVNYVKFNEFCDKLDEGALTWKWGSPYENKFSGYHSNCRSQTTFWTKTISNEEMIFHGIMSRPHSYLSSQKLYRDRLNGRLPDDSNFTFYYIPKSMFCQLRELHNVILEYYKYEDFVENLSTDAKNIIFCSKDIEIHDKNITNFINEFFNKYMDKLIKIN